MLHWHHGKTIWLYSLQVYINEDRRKTFEKEYLATGNRYDAGKSYVRFRILDDLPLNLISNVDASMSVDEFIEDFENIKGR